MVCCACINREGKNPQDNEKIICSLYPDKVIILRLAGGGFFEVLNGTEKKLYSCPGHEKRQGYVKKRPK